MMRRSLSGTLFAAVTLVAVRAHAGDPTKKAEAAALFNEGTRLMGAKDYEHARVKFLACAELFPSDNVWWSLAFAEYRSGHWVDALRHARKYLRTDDKNPKHIETFNQELLPAVAPHVGQLTIDAPPDALITIDGSDEVGRTPLADAVAVEPGKHHIEARRDKDTAAADVTIAEGAAQAVTLAFAAPAPPTPVRNEEIDKFLERSTDQPALSSAAPEQEAARRNPLHVWLPVALAGAGAVSIVAGAVFVTQSNKAADDAQALRSTLPANSCSAPSAPGCGQLRSYHDTQNTDATASVVFYSLGAACLLGAGLAWILTPADVTTKTSAQPLIGPGMIGGRWSTTF